MMVLSTKAVLLLLQLLGVIGVWDTGRVMEGGDIFLEGVHLRKGAKKAAALTAALDDHWSSVQTVGAYSAGPCGALPADGEFMNKVTEYLPDAAARPATDDADGRRFRQEMLHRQLCASSERIGASSSSSSKPVSPYGWCYYGTGACMHTMRKSLERAFNAGHGLKIGNDQILEGKPTPFCKDFSIKCYFEEPPFGAAATAASNAMASNEKEKDWGLLDDKKCGDNAQKLLQAQFGHRGKFWIVAQQMNFVFRLTARFAARVAALKAELGYAHPIIGMQVRHGDTCRVREVCWPLADFIAKARVMKEKYGVRNIFLATDSEAVVEEATAKYGKEFHFIHQQMDRSKFDLDTRSEELKHLHPGWNTGPGNLDTLHAAGLLNSNKDVETILLDVELLAQADYLISAFSTNVARLAYELMVARRGCLPPFVSLDIPWCHNDGQAMGKKYLTEKNMRWDNTAC